MAYRWATRLMCRRAAKKQVVRSLLAHRGPQYGQQSWSPFLQKEKKASWSPQARSGGAAAPTDGAIRTFPRGHPLPRSPAVFLGPGASKTPATALGRATTVGQRGLRRHVRRRPRARPSAWRAPSPATLNGMRSAHLPEQEETHPLFPVS